jgi:plasmid stabilization system protein ParE
VTITWRVRALRDMQEIQAFVTAGSSAAQGYETLVALHEQINDLLVNPKRGRIDPRRPSTRFFIAPVGSQTYRVHHRIRGERIYIIRVRDTRRRDT